ncbi:MAG: hypothetical protein OHK0019_08450 [Saprospiraceae bacterium]
MIWHNFEICRGAKADVPPKILVNWREEFVPLSISGVAYFFTDSGISWLVRADGKRFVVDETMEEIANQLNPDLFFRLNRQVVTRPEAIKQIHKHFNGKLKITLQPNLTEEGSICESRHCTGVSGLAEPIGNRSLTDGISPQTAGSTAFACCPN